MAALGFAFLVMAFASSVVAAITLFVSSNSEKGLLSQVGRAAVVISAAALLVCCAVLVGCFFSGDYTIKYVLEERSLSTGGMAWLFKLSGLWAGRSGSLLFWVFLIALFNVLVLGNSARRSRMSGASARLDGLAMAVVSVVMAAFCGVLLFSSGNMPFEATPDSYFDANGNLTAQAQLYSMNQLLEHWAMAIHPPLLFIGYAGLTVPFAYAIAALVAGDASKSWVVRSQRIALASWLFLSAGIGLGAVWAYVVLGWGGYWGWDPVENASLLPWLLCTALIHSFTVYRQRGASKRWALLCACLAFTFVIVATFITRSGIVQSVHAFAGDPVSLTVFGGLIAVSILAPAILAAMRWKSFAADVEGADDVDNIM